MKAAYLPTDDIGTLLYVLRTTEPETAWPKVTIVTGANRPYPDLRLVLIEVEAAPVCLLDSSIKVVVDCQDARGVVHRFRWVSKTHRASLAPKACGFNPLKTDNEPPMIKDMLFIGGWPQKHETAK